MRPDIVAPERAWRALAALRDGDAEALASDPASVQVGYRRRPVRVAPFGDRSVRIDGALAETSDDGAWIAFDERRLLSLRSGTLADLIGEPDPRAARGRQPDAATALAALLPDGAPALRGGLRYRVRTGRDAGTFSLDAAVALAEPGAPGICALSTRAEGPGGERWARALLDSLEPPPP